MENEEKYEIVQKVLIKHIGEYLAKYEYKYIGNELSKSENSMEFFIIYYANSLYEICFYYHTYDYSGNLIELLSPFLSKKPDHNGHLITHILEEEKVFIDKHQFSLLHYEGTFEQKVEQWCHYVIQLIDLYLVDWISGKKWKDIPFDWGPYK